MESRAALFTIAFVFSVADNCAALQCYDCGWSASTYEPKGSATSPEEEPPPYPVSSTVIGNKTHPPDRSMMKTHCSSETCRYQDSACMKWSFMSGSPENITYMCVGNPGNRKGCYKIEVPHGDTEKKYNTKILNVQVCLCNDRDFCNFAGQTASFAILVTVMALSVLTVNKQLYYYS